MSVASKQQSDSDPVRRFIDRVDRLEERYGKNKYGNDVWFMPVPLLKEIREILKERDVLKVTSQESEV